MSSSLLCPLGALLGLLFGCGLLLVVGGLRAGARPWAGTAGVGRRDRARAKGRLSKGDLLLACASGLAAFALTRWPVAVILASGATLCLRALSKASEAPVVERLEAIALWTEMLADTLAGASGLTQALLATAPICPRPIRAHVEALAARLRAGIGLVPALVELGAGLADPAGDTVVACLVMAASERAQRLSELLSSLSAATGDEVAMRLDIEAARASARSSVRTITGLCLGLVVLLALAAHSYLAPYGTPVGEVVLALVGCIFGFGIWLMAAMVRPRALPRLELDWAALR